jgi:hypothetical protein
VFGRARGAGLIAAGAEVAVDATGLDTRHPSRHYVQRPGCQRSQRAECLIRVLTHDLMLLAAPT